MTSLVTLMFICVVVLGIGLLIFISLTRKGGRRTLDQDRYRSRWLEITQKFGDSAESWQFAVLSADKLLDSALRDKGVAGDTLGERLKNAKGSFSNLDSVWRAHKLRNHIAHDHNVAMTKRQAAEALKIFKRALADLGAL